jgi:hypothetical protein
MVTDPNRDDIAAYDPEEFLMKKRQPKTYSLPIDHQLVKSAITGAFVCSACLKVCMSYESQVEPCPKLSVE